VPPIGVSRIALVALMGAYAGVLGCDGRPIEPVTCSTPEVVRSYATSNPNNVLSAIVSADVRLSDSIAARFGRTPGPADNVTPAIDGSDGAVEVPLLGLHEATRYTIQLVAFNDCGQTAGELLSLETGTLPPDLPRYTAAGTDPSPGYVVFAAGNYGIVIDNAGRVVWYHRFPNGPGLNFQAQPNGRYTARPAPASSSELARWVEIDPLGNVTRTFGCGRGLQARMHDMIGEADGTYWLLCDEVRTMDLAGAGGSSQTSVLGTSVQHVGANGDVLFDWAPFDHFEVDVQAVAPGDQVGALLNWTHGNALDLDADGNLLVSFRNLSEITKIDTRTGAVVWRMGGFRNQFTFENIAAPAFARQHGVRATGSGGLVLLDNLGDPLASRAERYEFDETRRTVRLVSSFASSRGAVAQTGGTTQSLPGIRTLVSFGNGGSVEETDASGNVVWKINGNPGYVFRAQRIRSLYHPGVGDPR